MELVLIGGFLGSGKTTAIVKACQQLISKGRKVAVITNDQGDQQVDSLYVKSFGIPTGEVANGCFCCNYNELDSELQALDAAGKPDIIFAESVGSCTDMIATLVKPLGKMRPNMHVVVCIFIDATLFSALIEGRASFLEESVRYIFRKQLEEADLLILNKTDLLAPPELVSIKKVLESEYPSTVIHHQNSLDDQGILSWITAIEQFSQSHVRQSLVIDYDIYGDGEANLAWLDKLITINTSHNDCVFVVKKIIGSIFNQIQAHHFPIGHLKFFLESGQWKEKISFTTTSTSEAIILSDHKTNCITMLVNARVQTEPDKLKSLIDDVLATSEHSYSCKIGNGKWSSFKPGYPMPTHRVA